jgi:hypothetical protein
VGSCYCTAVGFCCKDGNLLLVSTGGKKLKVRIEQIPARFLLVFSWGKMINVTRLLLFSTFCCCRCMACTTVAPIAHYSLLAGESTLSTSDACPALAWCHLSLPLHDPHPDPSSGIPSASHSSQHYCIGVGKYAPQRHPELDVNSCVQDLLIGGGDHSMCHVPLLSAIVDKAGESFASSSAASPFNIRSAIGQRYVLQSLDPIFC